MDVLRATSRSARRDDSSRIQDTSSAQAEIDDHTHWHRQRHEGTKLHIEQHTDANAPIALEDHTLNHTDASEALWAKNVTVDHYAVIGGFVAGGSHVVWSCTVNTLDGGPIKIRKRYSDFDKLRQRLLRTFPHSEAAMPRLPRKSTVSRFSLEFLAERKIGLRYFLNSVLLNPEFAGSPVLREFLFS